MPKVEDSSTLKPKHIGFILDGNRRWASANGVPKLEGHKKGYDNLRATAELCFDKGIEYVSAYIFSTENWNRSKEEVGYLMGLVLNIASKELDNLVKENTKIVFLGTKDRLGPKVIKAIEDVEARSRGNTGGTLALCFNYGGQQEIADAVNLLVESGKRPPFKPDDIQQFLYAPDVPPVDLIIRTSGEQRLSNFMMWRSAYSELLFVKCHWPAFSSADLDAALDEYSSRARRFGA